MPVRSGLPQHIVDEIIKSIPVEYRTVGEINRTIDYRLNQLIPRTRRLGVTTLTLIEMYTKEHLTLREIGTKVGMLPQTVYKRLKVAGIKRTDGTYLDRKCGFCSKPLKVRRAVARKAIASYCNNTCRAGSRANPNFHYWRHGTRLAGMIINQHFSIPKGAVVHHKDGNDHNNDLANLAVYASQSDHMKAHHKKNHVEPIWDGSQLE